MGFVKSATAAVEKQTGEHVELVYVGSRPGAWGALITSEVAGGAADLSSSPLTPFFTARRASVHRADGSRAALPTSFLVTVTAGNVYLHKHKEFWGRVTLKKELATFPRARLRVAAVDRKITRRFALYIPDPRQFVIFEAYRKHELTDRFTDMLGATLVGSPAELLTALD